MGLLIIWVSCSDRIFISIMSILFKRDLSFSYAFVSLSSYSLVNWVYLSSSCLIFSAFLFISLYSCWMSLLLSIFYICDLILPNFSSNFNSKLVSFFSSLLSLIYFLGDPSLLPYIGVTLPPSRSMNFKVYFSSSACKAYSTSWKSIRLKFKLLKLLPLNLLLLLTARDDYDLLSSSIDGRLILFFFILLFLAIMFELFC